MLNAFRQASENLKQYRTSGGDKPLPGERTPKDRFVRAEYYAENLPKPANRDEGAAFMFSVIRNVSVQRGENGKCVIAGVVGRRTKFGDVEIGGVQRRNWGRE